MGYVVSQEARAQDPHLKNDCAFCHKGNPSAKDRKSAHAGLLKRPSDDPEVSCGSCHPDIAKTYTLSLHYTAAGMKHTVSKRFSEAEKAVYGAKVFEQSCRSCHASCGDCHVKSPVVSGVNLGLMDGHLFVRKDESKTCALCHGGRVYPEFTGDYGGTPDVHYRKGMSCADCHSSVQFHGDGTAYLSRTEVKAKPSCAACHELSYVEKKETKEAHSIHEGRVSCSACHTASAYRQCSGCHLGEGAVSSPAVVLGKNPRKPGELTTLRLIPTVRDTFKKAGISQANFDSLPNYWNTMPHNIAKRTDRTRDCNTCHEEGAYYLEADCLPKDGSRKNLELVP